MRDGSLRRYTPYQEGHGLKNVVQDIVKEGLSEGLKGIDTTRILQQAAQGFKRGAVRGIKRKAANSKAARQAKKIRDIFS